MGIARTVITPVEAQTINSAATYTSAEQDMGADTLVERAFLYFEATFSADPADTGTCEITIQPVHTTSGEVHAHQAYVYSVATPNAATYRSCFLLPGLPRFFKVAVKNNTNQNSGTSGVTLKLEVFKVTA
jgi:hypothetical protein